MAGEWIAVDLALDEKPEVQELIDLTGHSVEVVTYRLRKLWGWASMHCADGTARMTIPRLTRTCGGDDAFWRAVVAVGWLEIDETAATVAVPGWDRRFSQAAKARLQHQDRAKAQDERDPGRKRRSGTACAQAQDAAALERSRGEERTGEVPPPPPACAEGDQAARWATLRAAWNAKPADNRRPWTPPEPPDEAVESLADPEWLPAALEAIGRLRGCKYFRTPVALTQFCGPRFVKKVLQGKYDELHDNRKPSAARPDDRPPPQGWNGDDTARLEATKRAMAQKLRASVGE
jgi:hypothetical protein